MFFTFKKSLTLLFSHGAKVATPKPLSGPASLKNLCRDALRNTMRILTNNRTIQPLVVSLENSGDLDKNCGNLLVYDFSGNWREKLVMIDNPTGPFLNILIFPLSGHQSGQAQGGDGWCCGHRPWSVLLLCWNLQGQRGGDHPQ